MKRCTWANGNDLILQEYHDFEYGRVKDSDERLFEKLCLEIFQAGLSWRTVLYKRDAMRKCFFDFDVDKICEIREEYIYELLQDKSIIRNRRKIEAVISNARLQKTLFRDEGSFAKYVYSFNDKEEILFDLKQKGYKFVGVTICESFLMSVGAIEGHEEECYLYKGEV